MTTSTEHYAGGYGPLTIEGLSTRTLGREGAFLLPHLRPGMRVLDCGCGPGVMTAALAAIVSPGDVIGIDIETGQLQLGRERARERRCTNVRFGCSDVYTLPFPNGTFDIVFAHAVVYHLKRPVDALREMHRVLKPGGILAIRDADSGGDIYAPASASLDRVWSLVLQVFDANGASLQFARTHRGALREVGFVRTRATASYDCVGTPDGTRWFAGFWIHFLGELHADLILGRGWVSRAELDTLLSALNSWGDCPDAFYARCRCEALGWKAAGPGREQDVNAHSGRL